MSTGLNHPYGLKPLGNLYMNLAGKDIAAAKRLSSKRRFDSLGNLIGKLQDNVVLSIFSYFTASSLGKISSTSRFFYLLSHRSEFWKVHVLEKFGGSFKYCKTWKDTYVNNIGPVRQAPHVPIATRDVYSDLWFQSFFCSRVPLRKEWLEVDNIDRQDHANLSVADFVRDYEKPRRPVLFSKDISSDWEAMQKWNWDFLKSRFQVAENGGIHAGGFTFDMKDYISYAFGCKDEESPLYIFDKKFADKSPTLGKDYSTPKYFDKDRDLFSMLGERRPDYRWLIAGPGRSGSSFHIDPNGTNAWNAVITGAKKWIMFPPHVVPPGVHPSSDGADVATPVSIVEWFLNFYSFARDLNPIECIVQPGEIIFVPQGWWHLVLNLETGIAVTQNYVSESSLSVCLDFLRNKPDQISGIESDRRPRFYDEFVSCLKLKRNDLYEKYVVSKGVSTKGNGGGKKSVTKVAVKNVWKDIRAMDKTRTKKEKELEPEAQLESERNQVVGNGEEPAHSKNSTFSFNFLSQ